ncbi:AF4/FMR2 family member lilli isoform X1 [Vanessa atalanta]|uniref:AF4/FMR2 family member lilli isoform X1 n=1 Tax=Vanessa atalanta TaxID=42275 RepID=UPI001FCDF19D|nr:AF4/FMR2 family member lilli isoform X1 [Vanessa atalanta]XP_047538662.1 AF4/FMR2 family member lilli isoform X1 [Vanessa atalanta]
MHMCYERPGVVTALNGGVGYDKWERGGGGGGAGGAWAGREPRDGREPRAEPRDTRDRDTRDRERDRERERQARAHQMSHAHAAEPDASSLFPAPFRVTGNRDRVSQQIQIKLGDYRLAQTLLDDPSKSIGICAEPPSPAPCHPSRRENEFKKPANALQNGRVHHRPYVYNKSEGLNSTGAAAHRPPPLRIPNGIQSQNNADGSQPHIESILKEMKSLPTPLSVIAATPRKELENKFIFNPYTNKVQENTQLTNSEHKTTPTKPGLDNRISNSRSSVSPNVVNKDLGLSESDDEVAATTTRLEPILSPIGSGGSPSSGSESSPSDSESESSSAESSSGAAPPPAPAPPPAQRPSWSLSNFAPPAAHPPDHADLSNVLAEAKGKPSPISELSDSEASSPSPGTRRRRSLANRISTASSDDEAPRPNPVRTQTSPNISAAIANGSQSSGVKRGRPPKLRNSEERPAKKKRGRPPKTRPPSPAPDSEPEPEPPQPHPHPLQDTKTHIFRKVFTPKKGDECGGKGGKGGKGKGGKGKGQVTIIESGADDDDRRHRDRSAERRNEEAIARVSPPQEPETLTRKREAERVAHERIQERVSIERPDHRRPDDRISDRTTERTSNDRIPDRTDRLPERRSSDRLPPDRLSTDRLQERLSTDRLSERSDRLSDRSSLSTSDRLSSDRKSNDRLSGDKMLIDRIPIEKMSIDRLSGDKLSIERIPNDKMDRLTNQLSHDRLSNEKISHERLSSDKLSHERLSSDKLSHERLSSDKLSHERLSSDKLTIDRLSGDKLPLERVERIAPDRYVRAEADVGFVPNSLTNAGERVSRGRSMCVVSIPLSRLRAEIVRALQRPPRRAAPPAPTPPTPPADHTLETSGGSLASLGGLERAERCAGRTPIYYSYFERLPADALSDEERDHKYYLGEAKRLRTAAEREQEPLARVMLYLESVLCFVLTGRVLELELDTKRAFTIYRETIEYIKSIHSMPQRFRASPHSTFSKLDILSLRVQALLYLRMFKMYNREVREYNKIVQEYQQKSLSFQPACAEAVSAASAMSASSARSASPMSPSPSPAGSVGSGSGSGSSGYCSLAHAVPAGSGSGSGTGYCPMAHAVPAHAHHALLQLTKYYTFLYVAHDLWEQADSLCRLRPNQDLFIAVDRKCGPLTLFSTFRHLVQYVRHAISLLKNAPRE